MEKRESFTIKEKLYKSRLILKDIINNRFLYLLYEILDVNISLPSTCSRPFQNRMLDTTASSVGV